MKQNNNPNQNKIGENMKHNYKFLFITLFVGLGFLPLNSMAQDFTTCTAEEAECLVTWHDGEFNPVSNALRNTIANDTVDGARKHPDRVYVLETGGTYFIIDQILNNGFHLSIRTQSEDEVDTHFGPAKIQLETDEAGQSAGRLFTAQGDLTLEGLFITGSHDAGGTGNYLPIRISSDGARVVVKGSIFERTDFSLFGFDSGNNKVYIYDSIFRNHINSTQQWEGRGLRFENGADTLVIENTTFMNIGMTILQSEAAPINYTRFVHNTVVNVGRIFNAGNFWKEGYVANNLFVNHYWHGEGDADGINDGTREFPYTGFFTYGPIGPGNGFTDAGRRMVYSNNAHWRDPQFAEYYADTINAQPLFNSQTDSMFNTFSTEIGGSMYRANNWEGTDPVMFSYDNAPDLSSDYPATEISLRANVPNMIDNMRDLREARQSPFTDWGWDPGRNPDVATASVQSIMPQFLAPEDLSYTESTYLTAGTDGLPLGDLNWQEASTKADWLSNRSTYVDAIEALAGEVVVITDVSDGVYEAEWGTASDGATPQTYDGFVEYYIEGTGYVEWTFTIDDPVQIDEFEVFVRSNDEVRGANIFVDGTQISQDDADYGDLRFFNLGGNVYPEAGNTFTLADLDDASDAALNLAAGEHTIRWEPGWGYYTFSGIELRAGGEVVADLSGSKASDFSSVSPSAGPNATGWVPSLLRSVALNDGGTLTIEFQADGEAVSFPAGNYFMQVYYENTGDASAFSMTANGNAVGEKGEDAGFVQSIDETTVLTTDHFITDSDGSITVSITGSNARIDYVTLFSQTGGVLTDIEVEDVVGEYQLSQNYPNPFNPSTNINFTLPLTSNVQLTVFNLLGQKVATLIDGRMNAGQHVARFDARGLASGVYFYQLKAGDFTMQRRMTLIK